MVLGGLNRLVADLLQSGRDVLEAADIAIAGTTAILASVVPTGSDLSRCNTALRRA
jgi:hypothetical protein